MDHNTKTTTWDDARLPSSLNLPEAKKEKGLSDERTVQLAGAVLAAPDAEEVEVGKETVDPEL